MAAEDVLRNGRLVKRTAKMKNKTKMEAVTMVLRNGRSVRPLLPKLLVLVLQRASEAGLPVASPRRARPRVNREGRQLKVDVVGERVKLGSLRTKKERSSTMTKSLIRTKNLPWRKKVLFFSV